MASARPGPISTSVLISTLVEYQTESNLNSRLHSLRLDVYLKLSRLAPRRTVAQQLCEAGAVTINGQRAKSSREIRQGDELRMRTRKRIVTVRIAQVPLKPPSKAQAPSLYEVVSEEILDTSSDL